MPMWLDQLRKIWTSPGSESSVTWQNAYSFLASATAQDDSEAICRAITRLGKPLSQTQMTQAAPLVSQYLHHSNHVVRYQAIWFLGCWGRMSNYLDQIIQSAETDPDLDNRAFAARCSGLILKSHQNPAAMRALLRLVNNENGSADLRCAAYSALIYGYYGENGAKAAHEFDPIGTKSIADFDIAWLTSVANWVDGLNSDTEVGTIEGRSH